MTGRQYPYEAEPFRYVACVPYCGPKGLQQARGTELWRDISNDTSAGPFDRYTAVEGSRVTTVDREGFNG